MIHSESRIGLINSLWPSLGTQLNPNAERNVCYMEHEDMFNQKVPTSQLSSDSTEENEHGLAFAFSICDTVE